MEQPYCVPTQRTTVLFMTSGNLPVLRAIFSKTPSKKAYKRLGFGLRNSTGLPFTVVGLPHSLGGS